jgi:hypothetical protein
MAQPIVSGPDDDSQRSATALADDLTLVARGAKQLEGIGVRMLNPSEPA